jgi:hypothetical protein
MLLVGGHPHTALEQFRRAARLHPKDAAIRVYVEQAQGKLGHAELILDGKGSVTVDGKQLSAPRRLKLPAGPYTIDLGDGAVELTLRRGEHKHLRVKR